MHDEFEMSMMGELNFFLGLQIKQMEDKILFNQSRYIKEMLKKFGLEYSKPTKTPMSMEIKLTKDDEADSADSSISRIFKPFGCHVMILNTLDNLGKFEEKGDECYFIGYSMSSKAFRVFNKRTRRVEENLHVEFFENKSIEKGSGPNWLFDIDSLTKSMNYVPVDPGTISTNLSGTKDAASQEVKKDVSSLRYIALPNWTHNALLEFSSSKPQDHCSTEVLEGSGNPNPTASTSNPSTDQMETLTVETPILTVSSPVPTAYSTDSQEPSSDARLISKRVANQEETPSLDNILSLTNQFEDILRVSSNSKESNGVETNISNIEIAITASPTHTLRIHKDHPKSQIIGRVDTPIQTRNKSKEVGEQSFIATIHQKTDPALLQGKTHWDKMVKNKNDERGIVIRNKSRLVAQGHTQEEGIDYDEVFALVAGIEAIRLFLAYASFMGFIVYQMDVKSAFLYGTIDKKLYVMQPPGFQDLKFPAKVYKVEKVMYGLHQTLFIIRQRGDVILVQVYVDDIIFGSSNPHLCREFEALMHEKFQMSAMGDILKKFGYSDVRSSNTPMDKENPWGKDGAGKDVDLYLYRSMIGSLMYLTASRPDIMFAVCACAKHQVIPKECHLHAVKRIFRYLKSHPKRGLWYPKESPFDLVAYSNSDYGGATQDRISTTGGCQFLGRRTVTESSLRRNLKLKDEEGISSLPDTELFENLTLMGYNISPNQKFTFQKGQFSHQWKYLIHTIMQCLSPKSTGFNEFSSNIATALVYLATNRTYNFSKMIFDGLVKNVNNKGEGSSTPTEPHHTPSPEAQSPLHTTHTSPTLPPVTTTSIPTVTISDTPIIRTGQPSISPPPCPMIQLQGLLPLLLLRATQKVEINRLKERVKLLEDREGVAATRSRDDAPIKGRSMDEGEAATERISDDSEEMETVLTSIDAAIVLESGVVDVPTGSGSIPTASTPAEEQVTTSSEVVPTASPVFATATVVTPYRRRKGKEVMVESETPKKQKGQEQIDAQVSRELEEQLERGDQRRNNETVAKYLHEYHQFASELPMERRIELITDLVKYQDNYAKIYKYQSQQRKPMTKKQKRDYNMAVIRSNLGCKVKDFRGMTFEEVEAKFNLVWKQLEDFIPMGSNEEAERIKRKVDWRLYDTCGVHHVTAKDKEIFMLVEKDYPLRKALALVMICYKLQVENYS
nr:hypothetical protein [Tanacetum cinerariifolium]